MTDDDLGEYVRANRDLLARVLASGTAEGRAYALVLLANSDDVKAFDDIEEQLDRLKRQTN